ncbi:MAG: PstS family phosphate ABC transporter substrate-binding protein [Candidatus Sumerlaeia bacterium]|nr:PstS family phosphate ABC transporter substrate-binding protein [Candidatus Sumerlaeia bacterium]
MSFFRHLQAIAFGFTLIAATAMAPAQDRTRISIAGSDTMNLLTQRLAEEYMKTNPTVEISVSGGGTGVGIRSLMDGLVDIAQASREMRPSELQAARDNGYNPERHVIGLDGLAVVVHRSSPVDELSINQVRAIFSGAVTRWNQFNPEWPDSRIVVYSRESSSGTYDYFRSRVLGESNFANNVSYLAATAAISNSVGSDRNSIGFGGVAYFMRNPDIKILRIKADRDTPAYSPVTADGQDIDFETVQSGNYAISRPLHLYTRQEATGAIKDFLDWIKGPKGQRVVIEIEYIPLLPPDELGIGVADEDSDDEGNVD